MVGDRTAEAAPRRYRIRSATGADAADMLAIYGPIVRDTAASFEFVVPTVDEFRQRIERVGADDPWLVAEGDGRLAGYAYASPFRARPAYVRSRETTVYVAPESHGSGVGRRLMVELLGRLRQRGDRLAVAGIVLPNEASIGLHEALGFRPVGTFTDVGHKLGRWHDLGFWQLRLDQD